MGIMILLEILGKSSTIRFEKLKKSMELLRRSIL